MILIVIWFWIYDFKVKFKFFNKFIIKILCFFLKNLLIVGINFLWFFSIYIRKKGIIINKNIVEMKDVIYDIELDKIDVVLFFMDLIVLLIWCVILFGNLFICFNEKLINCLVFFCNDGVCLIKLLILEIMIGVINDIIIVMIIINFMNIVVILV